MYSLDSLNSKIGSSDISAVGSTVTGAIRNLASSSSYLQYTYVRVRADGIKTRAQMFTELINSLRTYLFEHTDVQVRVKQLYYDANQRIIATNQLFSSSNVPAARLDFSHVYVSSTSWYMYYTILSTSTSESSDIVCKDGTFYINNDVSAANVAFEIWFDVFKKFN